jgi:hypothetical protein
MAVQGSGLGKGPDEGEFKDQTKFDARSGAAKTPQKEFPTKWGMKDQQHFGDAAPAHPGTGPLAGGTSGILDPETPAERGKVLKRQPAPGEMKTAWGQVDANGKGLDQTLSGKVLGEAILSGAAKLPDSEAYGNAQPVRKPA